MVDDVPANLAPFLVDEIFDIVRKINTETKVAVLLVEQNVAAALEIAHSAYLVENGRIVMNGTAEVLRSNPDIDAAYLAAAIGLTITPSNITAAAGDGWREHTRRLGLKPPSFPCEVWPSSQGPVPRGFLQARFHRTSQANCVSSPATRPKWPPIAPGQSHGLFFR